MGVTVSMEGLAELREALRNAPEELTAKAKFIVINYANQAKQEIQGGYPIRQTNLHPGSHRKTPWYEPGNLHNRVTMTSADTKVSAVSIVKSLAPHAWIFEHGTRKRQTNTGANRGKMPEAPESARMIPKVQRLRARMVNELIALVREFGFEVSE